MIDVLKKLGLLALIGTALVLLGNGINAVIDWSWLVSLCKIMRVLIDPLDFIIDTTELVSGIGKALSMIMAFWTARGAILVINFLKNK